MFTPWIRSFNYIKDYYEILYKIYAGCYIASYPVTYYSRDMVSSIGDHDEILSGSYERHGIGELSGYKFKKINMFPVYGIDPVRPAYTSGEKGGITYGENITTKIVFPSTYGLKPLEEDIIDLSFGYSDERPLSNTLYAVSSVNIAHNGEKFQLYQLDLKITGTKKEKLENQISEYFMFYEFSKKILPLSNVGYLLKILKKYKETSNLINYFFDKKTGYYIFRS